MPRPEQVQPRAGADAEHGATAELQRLAAGMLVPPDEAAEAASQAYAGSPRDIFPEELPEGVEPDDPTIEDDLNDGFDHLLFGPSDRPDEPLTAGMPFGDGPSFTRRRFESDAQFLDRVAGELEASGDTTAQRFATRIRRGE